MAITSPTTPPADGAALPTPPSSSSPSNFDTLADAFLSAFPAFQTSMNATKANAYTNATAAYNNALQSQSDATTAQTAAATAQAYSGAIAWVSGTTYAIGDVRWSPGNGRVYRRITNGGGTTDPYNDPTNWSLVPTSIPITHITSALVTQASSGMFYAFERTTTQGSATNLLLYSSVFDNGTWQKQRTSIIANTIMSPDGTTTGDKLVEDTSSSTSHLIYQTRTASNETTTFSVYVKAAGRSHIKLEMSNFVNASNGAYYTLTGSGTITSVDISNADYSGTSGSIVHVGNGWYLCTLTTTKGAVNTANNVVIYLGSTPGNSSYTGDGTSGVYLWGAQLETGSTATSYIPTTSTTATRASGVVYPQRLILPSSPVNDMIVPVMVANGIETNIVDPNGATIMGVNGPIQLDNPYASVTFQYSSSTWRMINA